MSTTYEIAKRKAVFGHRDWIRVGESYEVLTKDALKRAMLAIGTSGHIYVLSANTGTPHRYGWKECCLMLRNYHHHH